MNRVELFLIVLGALAAYRLLVPVLDRVALAIWGDPRGACHMAGAYGEAGDNNRSANGL